METVLITPEEQELKTKIKEMQSKLEDTKQLRAKMLGEREARKCVQETKDTLGLAIYNKLIPIAANYPDNDSDGWDHSQGGNSLKDIIIIRENQLALIKAVYAVTGESGLVNGVWPCRVLWRPNGLSLNSPKWGHFGWIPADPAFI